MRSLTCKACCFETDAPRANDLGSARGNTSRFKNQIFKIWKCPRCESVQCVDPMDLRDIYRDYALKKRKLDFFARRSMGNLLSRLTASGLKREHTVLDYGCGNGIMINFLRSKGFANVSGFDPYEKEFSRKPTDQFDCVILNDVLEHVDDPVALLDECLRFLKPGGLLYVGTCEADGIEMTSLDRHIMRLHLPFHRVILSSKALDNMMSSLGLKIETQFKHSYMDTLVPFTNYRFLDELSAALDHNMDQMLEGNPAAALLRRPSLILHGFLGSLMPSAYEPAYILRKPTSYEAQ